MRLAIYLLLTAVVVLACAAPAAVAGEVTTPAGHRVRWDEGLGGMGGLAARQLPQVAQQVAAALGFPFPEGRAEIVFVRGLERIREETGAAIPPWAAGVCQGSRSRIVIRADLVDQSPLNPMVTTLRHEWVHLAWSRRARLRTRALPLWLEEGLAEDIGGGVTIESGAKLDFAARFGWLLDFETITRHWPKRAEDASLAYKQGLSFVRYFRRTHGADVFQRILKDLADGRGAEGGTAGGTPFEKVVFAHTGSTLSHWLAAWQVDVKERADPWFHLIWRDFQGTLLFVAALFSFFAFFVFRRRRSRQIEELPDDPLPHGAE